MKTLYFECMSGISGDMTVAALLDLGADEKVLRKGLDSLKVDGYTIEVGRVQKSGIEACDFNVILQGSHCKLRNGETAIPHGSAGHHTHSHGRSQGHPHSHSHEADRSIRSSRPHGHNHDHRFPNDFSQVPRPFEEHVHGQIHAHQHDEGHAHRNIRDIEAIIEASSISPRAKQMAMQIFDVVAQAEATVHGKPVDEVHFHEVGAVDSIVDIVGAAICIDNLGVDRVICSPLREGTGTVRCQHGIMPVPAPATLEITRAKGIPLVITDNVGEMVTPTGAAIVGALAQSFSPPADMVVKTVGYGAGKREYKTANVLRAMLLQEGYAEPEHEVVKLECNLDDMTGEELGWAGEKLLEEGALDVWYTPIYMKKSRPAHMLSVLAPIRLEEAMVQALLRYTSTIGVRCSTHRRHVMHRRESVVDTAYGPVTAKEASFGRICKTKVEFESAKKLAEEKNTTIKQILDSAYTELNRQK